MNNKRQIFLGVVMASILLVGAVLALVMAVVALCFLMGGYALSVDVMGLIWVSGLAIWLAGSLPVAKYVDPSMFMMGVLILFGAGLWLLFAISVAPVYGTVGLPIVLAALLGGTFLSVLLSFSGLTEVEPKEETK